MNVADLIRPPTVTAAPARRGWRVIALIPAGVAGLAALAISMSWKFRTADHTTDPVTGNEKEARNALAEFLVEQTPEERATRVINGSSLLPLMQAYYAGREIEVLNPNSFKIMGAPGGTRDPDSVSLELPRQRGLSTAVACLRRSHVGTWLLDWEIWIQSCEGGLRNFIMRPAEGEHTLRVQLTSSCLSGEKPVVEVSDPFGGTETISFDLERSDLTALYSRDLPFGKTRTATVQLVWLNDSLTGTLKPALRRHISWGYDGLNGVPPAPVDLPPGGPVRPPRPITEPESAGRDIQISSAAESILLPPVAANFTAITAKPIQGTETTAR